MIDNPHYTYSIVKNILNDYKKHVICPSSSPIVEDLLFLKVLLAVRSLAAPHGCVVVDIGHPVPSSVAKVLFPLPDRVRVHHLIVVGLHTRSAQTARSLVRSRLVILPFPSPIPLIMSVLVPMLPMVSILTIMTHICMILQILRNTLMLIGGSLLLKEVVDIVLEPRILPDDVAEQFLVPRKLSLQISTVSQIDIVLEAIDVHAARKGGIEGAEEVVDFAHAGLVSSVDELSCCWFVADLAFGAALGPMLVEAFDAQEAVAVEDELADVAETVLAFVAVLGLLVHSGGVYR